MAQSVGFGKLERTVISNNRLPADVQEARIKFKQRIREQFKDPDNGSTKLKVFENGHHRYIVAAMKAEKDPKRFEQVLPKAGHGQTYYEFDVGRATAPTPADPNSRGARRLVALVDPGGNVLKMYFTEDHYFPEMWMELQYP